MSSPETTRKTALPVWLTVAAVLVLGLIGVLGRNSPAPSPRTAERVLDDAGARAPSPRPRPTLATPAPVKGAGPEILAGTVVDVAGEPVPRAELVAEFELGPGVRSMKTGAGSAPLVTAVSASDGAFSLIGLEAGRYRLRVRRAGIYAAEVRFVEVPGPGIRIVVAREVAVRGLVVDGGMPVAAARVFIAGDGIMGQLTAVSDAQGNFSFPDLTEGQFQVWAVAGEKGTPATRVRRLGKGPFGQVVLALGPAVVVAGRVVDQQNRAGVSAAVKLTATNSDEPPRFGRSDATGAFRIEGVPLGRWSAKADAPGFIAPEAVSFEVGQGYHPTLELRRGGVIAGVVVTQRGSPIEDAVVSLRVIGKRGAARTIDATLRREQAALRAGIGQRSALAAGQRFIPRGELGVLLGPLPFPPPRGASAVRVARIVGASGTAPIDAGAADRLVPAQPGLASRFDTDGQGRFHIAGLGPGRYRVVVTHRDFADGLSRELSLGFGKQITKLRIKLVPGVVLVGQVSDNHGEVVVGATVTAVARGDRALRLMAATGTDGRYRLGPLAVNAALEVKAIGYGTVRRVVKVGAPRLSVQTRTVDFVLVKADAILSGRVRDAAGFPVRGAVVSLSDRGLSARPRSAATDDKGLFSIDKLAPGTYQLGITHADFPPGKGKGKTGAEASLRLAFGGGIDLEVRDKHTGAALVGARISAKGPGGDKRVTASGDDGAAKLVPIVSGRWTIEVSTAGYVRQVRKLVVKAGTKPRQITARGVRIELARGATIAGTVRDANGMRVRGATVTIGSASAKTTEEGRFRLTDVATGDQSKIEAVRGAARGHVIVPLRPGDELVTLEITIR